jgi:NACHT domain
MNKDRQDQSQGNASEFDLRKSFSSLNLAIDLPADTKNAIKSTLKYVDKKAIVEEFFLQSLAFTTMDDREEEITAAHKATFEWIFNSRGDISLDHSTTAETNGGLISWLKHDSEHNVYWINGKAGSGKSTLMRYVYEHPKTMEVLKDWAAEKPLICPRFFFWTSGTIEQKSASGLLRSLLHQIFQEKREMIPWAFPEMWLQYQDIIARIREPIVWSVELMMPALERFLRASAGQMRICFFIDGLDELEGDQEALVEWLRSTVQFSPKDFKACVSSRPWKVFQEAFVNIPQLNLQDLTRNDIWRYVDDNLNGALKVRRILKKDTETAEALKNQIAENSDGVFLWATLAVRTLIERTVSEDTIDDLFRKLTEIPTGLDDLFRNLLFKSKTKVELTEQSRILQIIQARDVVCDFTRHDSSNVVTVYQMVLADHAIDFDSSKEPAKMPDKEILQHCESVKNYLQDRCAGLLQIHQSGNKIAAMPEGAGVRFGGFDEVDIETLARARIGYLHRTVRDYFTFSGDFENIIKQTENISFDPHISLLRSHVLQLRFPLEPPERHRRLDEWWPDVILAMTHARYAKPSFRDVMVQLLNCFKSTLDWYWVSKPSDPLDNWARNAFSSYEVRMKYRTPYHYPFLSLAAKFGVQQYLEHEVDTENHPYKGGIPPLCYAIEYLVSRENSVYPLSSPDLVEMLLKKGHDPNLVYKTLANKDETPWLLTLKKIREADRRKWIERLESEEGAKRWTKIVESYIQHGADPNALIVEDRWDPAASALDVLTMISEKHQFSSFKKILDLLEQRGAILRAGEK